MYSQKLKNWNNELSPSPTKYNNVSEPTFGDLRISGEKKYFMLYDWTYVKRKSTKIRP